MDGAALDLTLFLVTTFVAAAVAGLAGFAFGLARFRKLVLMLLLASGVSLVV
jgi:hypothetical protein